MVKTVEVDLILEAIRARDPLGKEKLALESETPVGSLDKIIFLKRVPKPIVRAKLAKAVGVSAELLFPDVKIKRGKAS